MNEVQEIMPLLPKNWIWTTIGEISETTSGGTPSRKKPEFYKGTIPWIKSGELNDSLVASSEEHITPEAIESSNAKVFPKNTALVALYGATVGRTGVLGIDAATNQAVCAIFPMANAFIPKFMTYWLQFNRQSLIELSIGGAQPNISQGIIRSLKVPLAPPPEQHRIINQIEELFSRLDAGMTALQKAKAQLKHYRQAVLKAAVEGRLTEEWRKAHLKDGLVELPLGKVEGSELPCQWRLAILKDICVNITDGDHQAPPKSSSGIPFLVISNMSEGRLDFAKTRFVPEKYYNSIPLNRKPTKGDILYSLVGSYGIPVMVNTECKFCFQRHIGLLRPSEVVETKYLFYFLRTNNAFKQATSAATGTAQLTVSLHGLRNFKVPFPPLTEQKAIVSEIERRFSVSDLLDSSVEISLSQLDCLRQSILKRAFEGKLVPQDPNDEPASMLLERIKAERIKESPRSGRRNNTHQTRLTQ